MKNINKMLEYHELLMTYEDTSNYNSVVLPKGFHYEYFKNGDEVAWTEIHVSSGEFMSIKEGIDIFYDFFSYFLDKLSDRCFFVVTDEGEKVGTATISLLSEPEYGYEAVVDWFAIKKEYQGKHLAKPMINNFIKLAHDLGHEKLLLHTQTHTWLAAKLYLNSGFLPFMIENDQKGWQILKTITHHEKLDSIDTLPDMEMYFDVALNIEQQLNNLFKDNYEYSIWHKNGRHDVEVNSQGILYHFLYFIENERFQLIEDNKITLYEPELKDYWYESKLLSDPLTMIYNAGYNVFFDDYHYDTGCIDFPKEKWENKYNQRKTKNDYFAYIKNNNQFVGYVNYQFNKTKEILECGIVVEANKRGFGFAKLGLELLCEKAKENGIKELYDEFELERENTLKLFESTGFKVISDTTIIKFNKNIKSVVVKKKL